MKVRLLIKNVNVTAAANGVDAPAKKKWLTRVVEVDLPKQGLYDHYEFVGGEIIEDG